MRRRGLAILVMVAWVLVGCESSQPTLENRVGDCTFRPHTVCRNQDLSSLVLQNSDLTGADFSGSKFNNTDLRNSILRDAKFVKADLGATDLTNADLRGADLSGALLFRVVFDGANWAGSNRAGAQYCDTVLPDGSLSTCQILNTTGAPPPVLRPPAVLQFRLHRPVRCLKDALGEGVELDWSVAKATSVSFLRNDVRVADGSGSSGIKRIPVPCDRKSYRLTIQAFGAAPPVASRSVTVALEPGVESPGL